MSPVSSIFVSHGSPSLLIEEQPARYFLEQLGRSIARPEAIVIFSAHSVSEGIRVGISAKPAQVYDFQGFAPELYDIRYEPEGEPALGHSVISLLEDAGIWARGKTALGLDHGMWVPLRLMYPEAQVPIVPVTLDAGMGAEFHLKIGSALRPLKDRGVLIIGSGGLAHNLSEFGRYPIDSPPPDYVSEFADRMEQLLVTGRAEDIVKWRETIPFARRNHPTPEHFIPLLVALGAGRDRSATALHRSYAYGILAMDAYAFH